MFYIVIKIDYININSTFSGEFYVPFKEHSFDKIIYKIYTFCPHPYSPLARGKLSQSNSVIPGFRSVYLSKGRSKGPYAIRGMVTDDVSDIRPDPNVRGLGAN